MCRKIRCDGWKRKYFELAWGSEQGHRVCLVPRKGVKKSIVARFGFIW
jgi:hypothetical protein